MNTAVLAPPPPPCTLTYTQNIVLGSILLLAYICHSILLSFHSSINIWGFPCITLIAFASMLTKFPPHYNTAIPGDCRCYSETGAEGSALQELCYLVCLSKRLVLWLIVYYTFWNQLLNSFQWILSIPHRYLVELSFPTIQIYYRHIKMCMKKCLKKYFSDNFTGIWPFMQGVVY